MRLGRPLLGGPVAVGRLAAAGFGLAGLREAYQRPLFLLLTAARTHG